MFTLKSKLSYAIACIFLTFFSLQSLAQTKDFQFLDQNISPGTKAQILLPVQTPQDSTVIPISVFHGKNTGPVLTIVAGVHSLEYVPIMAAQQFSKDIDPEKLFGTVILVHVANVPGFIKRSFRVNPQDGKNLNRIFPGSEDGSITEKIAWTISNEIFPLSDYYIDVHAGDANNDLRPYAGYYNYYDRPEVSKKAEAVAEAMGFPFIVQFGNEQRVEGPSVYTSREAFVQDIPAVDIECGRMGIVEEKFVTRIKEALTGVMKHLKMMEGEPEKRENPVFIAQRTTVSSEHDGFFFSDFTSGDYVKKGIKLGYITDLFGNHLTDVICPVDGMILYKSFNPPIEKGSSLFSIGHID